MARLLPESEIYGLLIKEKYGDAVDAIAEAESQGRDCSQLKEIILKETKEKFGFSPLLLDKRLVSSIPTNEECAKQAIAVLERAREAELAAARLYAGAAFAFAYAERREEAQKILREKEGLISEYSDRI